MNDDPKVNPEAPLSKSDENNTPAAPVEPAIASRQVIPQEILDKLPGPARHILEFSMMQMGPMPNPLLQHVNSTHIDKALDNAEKADARQAEAHREEVKDRKHTRITTWVGIAILIVIIGVLWMAVPADKLESLKEIVTTLITLAAVGFGGYGYAMSKLKDRA